jgi:hypothetical protein
VTKSLEYTTVIETGIWTMSGSMGPVNNSQANAW